MRTTPYRLAIVALVAGLVLAGCQHKSPEQQLAIDDATPQLAVENAVDELKAGNFDVLAQHLLPPADYQKLKTNWQRDQQRSLARVTAAQRQRFTKEMAQLTAPDAKQKQMAKLAPVLDAWEKKYKQRVPMVVGIFRIMVGTKITQSDTLTGKQKIQARGVLDALSTWAQDTDWGDKAKAKQAVGVVVDTARALKLKTLDAAYQLDYTQAMQRYGTAWKGLTKLLAVYGLPIDTMLDSIKVKPVAPSKPGTTAKPAGDTAIVEIDYTILGKPMTSTLAMVREDKRWYLKGFLDHWRAEHAAPTSAASTAPATSAPATATTSR